jgi:hypothetical protein
MKILAFCLSFVFIGLSSMLFGPVIGVSPGYVMVALTAASFIPMPSGVLGMAVTKELWLNDIVENLFKSNPHLDKAFNADSFVLQGKVVHIPQAGNKSVATKNRTVYPAAVITRTDSDVTFSLDEFSTEPTKISNAEKYELSYDKRQSVMGGQNSALAESVGDWFYYYWAPVVAAAIRRTTGANVNAHIGTGVRKLVTLADVKGIAKVMDNQGISKADRYACLDAEMYDQFTDTLTATQNRDFSQAYNQETGVVGKLFGFTFLENRPTVLSYNNDALPIVYDPTAVPVAATAMAAGLFWQKDCVIRALGTNEFFETIADPLYYGDIYSALVRAGGRLRRADNKGVVALIQSIGV